MDIIENYNKLIDEKSTENQECIRRYFIKFNNVVNIVIKDKF